MVLGKVTSGSGLVLFSGVAEQGASLFRNVLLANLLGVYNMGIAASLMLTILFLEMVSNFSLGSLIVQSKNTESKKFVAFLQFLEVARGLILSTVLFFLSPLIAIAFGIPEAEWAFKIAAVVPLINGFRHIGINVEERRLNFAPFAMTTAIHQFGALALTWPFVIYFHDYRAALYLVIIQACVSVVVSHVSLKQKFRIAVCREHLREVARFGLPLLGNGILLFGSLQLDRAVVGMYLGPAELGIYSVAALLALNSCNLARRVIDKVAFPILSSMQSENPRFVQATMVTAETYSALAAVAALGFALFSTHVVGLLFSSEYAPAALILVVLGIGQALRIYRTAPMTSAMAMGNTFVHLYSNVIRALGGSLAIIVAVQGGTLVQIALTALVAEVLALALTVGKACSVLEIPISAFVAPILKAAVIVLPCYFVAMAIGSETVLQLFMTVGVYGAACVACVLIQPGVRAHLYSRTPLYNG